MRKKLEANELEVRALKSFNNDVPMIFTEDTKKHALSVGGSDKSHLELIKSYKDWDTPGLELGLCQHIAAKALNIQSSLACQISTHFCPTPLLFSLANHMLDTSFCFVEALHQYISLPHQPTTNCNPVSNSTYIHIFNIVNPKNSKKLIQRIQNKDLHTKIENNKENIMLLTLLFFNYI